MQPDIQFSQRENEVVNLLLQGKSNKQMALALGISVRAIEFHLSNIYSKLGVNSRTEAALKLSAGLRESTVTELQGSTVVGTGENVDNDVTPVSTRRLSMKNLILVGAALLTTALLVVLLLAIPPVTSAQFIPSATTGRTPLPPTAAATPTATLTPKPTISPKSHILEQIRQAVAEYEQNVQAEKKNGSVEFGKDPLTGEDVFHFKEESFMRILALNEKLNETINQLDALYTQVYRDELKPTPFPIQPSTEQNKAYYEAQLGEPANRVCSLAAWQQESNPETIQIYELDAGSYRTVYIGDTLARCEVFGQMLEEFRTAPILARVNKETDALTIRTVTGKSNLHLTFQSIQGLANASGRNSAVYKDETGCKYYVDVDSGRLAQIEPNIPSHPEIPADKTRSIDELRGIAEQFALTNSPRLAALKSVLQYEEGGKTVIYFFTWTYRARDWSGTDWAMMPPFLQVGVLADGQVLTYINTLDLYK